MWIFTTLGFFSAVCARKGAGGCGPVDPDRMMVRARSVRHLQNLLARFPELADHEITMTPGRDYAARVFVSKDLWRQVFDQLIAEIEYDNFKDADARAKQTEFSYHSMLHEVWSVTNAFQRKLQGLPGYGKQVRTNGTPSMFEGATSGFVSAAHPVPKKLRVRSEAEGDRWRQAETDLKEQRARYASMEQALRECPTSDADVDLPPLPPETVIDQNDPIVLVVGEWAVGGAQEIEYVAILCDIDHYPRGRVLARDAAALGHFERIPRSRLRLERMPLSEALVAYAGLPVISMKDATPSRGESLTETDVKGRAPESPAPEPRVQPHWYFDRV